MDHIRSLPSESLEGPLGLAVFDSLRAEDEPWLPLVFEPPPEFELMSGSRSAIIFGEAGSGKTAVYQELVRSSLIEDGKPQKLLVTWHPTPPMPEHLADSYLVRDQLTEVMDACAIGILTHLAHYPTDFFDAPEWGQGILVWFIRRHLRGDFELRTGALSTEIDETGRSLLAKLGSCPVREFLYPDAAPELIIAELVKALRAAGLDGAWVLVNGLEAWSETEPDRLAAGLTAFLSALSLFERGGFAYKIFIPSALKRSLSGAGSIVRRRVDVHHLRWPVPKLVSLVEKRLVLATDRKINSLAELCEAENLQTWLERCGAHSPRGWLECVRPLIAAYLDQIRLGHASSITEDEWKEIRRRHPPALILNESKRQVTVGWRQVRDLPTAPYALLSHLYERAGQICSKSELYYLAYRGLDTEPLSPADPNWEAPKDYDGLIDTTIWRLRSVIEPDPSDPIFIITVKGQGMRLENAW